MNNTLAMTLTLVLLPCAGWPQTRTPAEMIAMMESDVPGRTDSMYRSEINRTPADKNLAGPRHCRHGVSPADVE